MTETNNPLIEWLIHLPEYLANVMEWLTTPFSIGSLSISPLGMLGASLGAVLAVLIALKIKSLIVA